MKEIINEKKIVESVVQVRLTIFTCDYCGAKSEKEKKFPYEKEWCYLHEFSFKLAENLVPGIQDKHFCHKECMKQFLIKNIDSQLIALFG